MDTKITTINTELVKGWNVNRSIYRNSFPVEVIKTNPVFEKFSSEGYEDCYNYLEWLGLSDDTNLIILPSSHHYYYDTEDMKDVRTVVNLKHLNNIKLIKDLFRTVNKILPHKSYFIGSFIDNKNKDGFFHNPQIAQQTTGKVDPVENGIASSIPFLNMIYNMMDLRTFRSMTKRSVTLLIEDADLKVLDMTDFNGFTYFCAQKSRAPSEKLLS